MRRLVAAAALLALAACGKGDNEPGPGGVTVGEARALDEAAQMIEARRAPVELSAPLPDPVVTASATAGAKGREGG